ncbi:MAG: hypothetical protein Q8O19_01285 [Rectinemataceae bacterium]|nr:hypothetical protein [Rectinemataceae bacterium]
MIVKLVPAVLAVTPYRAGIVVLHVTDNFAPSEESYIRNICELAVTAVVFTTTVVADAATTTDPAEADVQTAGEAEDEQLVKKIPPQLLEEFPRRLVPPPTGLMFPVLLIRKLLTFRPPTRNPCA